MTDLSQAIEIVVDEELDDLGRFVSVIIPAFDEGAHVAQQVRDVRRALDSTDWVYEIIVIDDGSSDATSEEAASAGARVIRRPVNRGYGAALKLGVERAQYDWVLITDADGTYPPEAIPTLLESSASQSMVVGARTGADVNVPIARRPAKWLLARLANYLAGQKLPDLNSGLRVMRKSLIDRYAYLLPDGFSFTTTITLAAACNGHPVSYVPINYHARLGRSKIRPRHAYDFAMLIVRTIVFFNPLKVFLPLGALLALAGLAKFAYDVTRDNLSESAIFALLSAMIVWSVGLLADQNTRLAARRR